MKTSSGKEKGLKCALCVENETQDGKGERLALARSVHAQKAASRSAHDRRHPLSLS